MFECEIQDQSKGAKESNLTYQRGRQKEKNLYKKPKKNKSGSSGSNTIRPETGPTIIKTSPQPGDQIRTYDTIKEASVERDRKSLERSRERRTAAEKTEKEVRKEQKSKVGVKTIAEENAENLIKKEKAEKGENKTDECNSKTGSSESADSKSNRRAKQAENRAKRQEKEKAKDVVVKEEGGGSVKKEAKKEVKKEVDKPKLASEIIAYSKKLDAAEQSAQGVPETVKPVIEIPETEASKTQVFQEITINGENVSDPTKPGPTNPDPVPVDPTTGWFCKIVTELQISTK